MRRFLALAAALLAFAVATAGPHAQAKDPIVILVSIDGWRWDYIDHANVPHLKALASRGVRAKELIPSFPSLTFPNHYTVATGLYPSHHGIVHNVVWDEPTQTRFTMQSSEVRNGMWWGGEPIWVTAVKQGRRAYDMFWPGSEAPIGGVRPDRYWPFDDKVPNEERVDRVLTWLALPDAERPAFATLYFSEVDHAGHDKGPLSPEVLEACVHVDAALGRLVDGVRRLGLDDRVNFVVVSDHGMTRHGEHMVVYLDDKFDTSTMNLISMGEMLEVAPLQARASLPGELDRIYRALKGTWPQMAIYKRDEVPERLHYRGHPRIAPIIGVMDLGWTVTTWESESRRRWDVEPMRGTHGYDPANRDMHALFVAAGPLIQGPRVVDRLENIQIYEFLCALLKLTPAKNDGDPAVTRSFLRR